ncbi:VIT and vWA domain-containing protein [Ramlibacter humi]|uniref:VWA domain-containing protein n=1 Tax=Ramlibacter humi TaxID=2530451 RepID=A0A4Z0BRE2_9BURK|nr:VWA domain-containing protein [Ramlibacter humi]
MDTPLSPAPQGALRWLMTVTAGTAAACFLTFAPARAEDAAPPQKTESPYFFVQGADPAVDRLPLKGTQVDVRISGVIADVTVTQTYRNEGRRPIEAKYVFPGSTRAAVNGLTVRLGERIVTARIREKQQARVEYEQAKGEGKTAALLEQHRPNVFQMNVANILPGDDVKVELRYTELLVPQSGNYRFVFPTVVGPRYNSPQSADAGAKWIAQPTLPPGTQDQRAPTFDLKVALASPIGLKEIHSTTHQVEVTEEGDKRAGVTLARGEGRQDNRDFILDYRLAGDRIESGVMLYRGQDENFFLAMVEPPKHVAPAAISPREYIFVVDISGSMHGFPLDTAKAMLRELVGGLKPSDTFNVLLFSGSSEFLAPRSVPATRANIDRAMGTLANYRGGGSTELIPALRKVYAEPKTPDVARTVVVVTDGYVSVEREAFELVRRHLSEANVFAFGIGSSVNRHLMEGLARAGMGEPFIITDPAQAPAEAARFRKMIESPVLTSVNARFEGLEVYDVEPRELPDVLGERPVLVFGKWRGDARGQVVIEGRNAAGTYREALPVGAQVAQDTAALRYLWARHRIARLSDQEGLEGGDGLRQQITDLGLRYTLLTQYTSFLAVDQVVRTATPATAVDQPLPLPQGVEATAVGAEVPGTPEPATWGAVFVTLSVLAMLARRARRQRAERFTA